MFKYPDLTGKTFNYLTVIEREESSQSKRIRYKCKCKCGKYVRVNAGNLVNGRTKSCRCIGAEKFITHGMSGTHIHEIWLGMRARCYNQNNKSYHNYGARGITICDEWKNDFSNFYQWSIQNGYQDGLSIDRIDVNGDYCPQNCRWITMEEQAKNRRNNIIITHNGETKILADWCREYNYSPTGAAQRYREMKKQGKEITLERLFYDGNYSKKAVNQYSIDGTFIRTWESLADAGRAGYDRTGISMCCHGKRKSSSGYVWKIAEN